MALNMSLLDEQKVNDLLNLLNPAEFAELVSAFHISCDNNLNMLRQASAGKDMPRFRFAAHALKGSSGNIGATKLAQLFYRLEQMGSKGRLDTDAGELMLLAETMYKQVLLDLQEKVSAAD